MANFAIAVESEQKKPKTSRLTFSFVYLTPFPKLLDDTSTQDVSHQQVTFSVDLLAAVDVVFP